MNTFITTIFNSHHRLSRGLSKLYPLGAITARMYIAHVFFLAGLTKINDWETTLFLFEEEYQVPILSAPLAAISGTGAELLLPILLSLGLLTRFAAVGLFFVNMIAVISLPEIAPAAFYLHVIWGILLAQLAVHGAGVWSLDALCKDFAQHARQSTTSHL